MPRKLRLPRLIDRSRLFFGFLVAALLPGTMYGLIEATKTVSDQGVLLSVADIGKFALLFLFFTIPAILFFGLPIFLAYRRLAWETTLGFVLAGAASAMLWIVAFASLKAGEFPAIHLQDLRLLVLRVAIPGAMAGLAFYLTVYVKFHHIKWSYNNIDKRWLWLLLIPALLVQERLLDWANSKIDENSGSLVEVMGMAWDWLSHDIF